MKRTLLHLGVALATVAAAACESTKSANPLSPTVAGPIPGVNISPPRLVAPSQGFQFDTARQPITLVVENASTNGVRPLFYDFEVATDAGFKNKVFSKTGVPQGEGGRTSLRLPSKLASGRTYYWRAMAQDGANSGQFTAPVSFRVIVPVVIHPPAPQSPVKGATISPVNPRFRFANAPTSGPAGKISYRLEVALNDAFTRMVAVLTFAEGSGSATSFRASLALPESKTVYWRVRAFDAKHQGPWSATQVFKSGKKATGGSGGGGGGPAAPPGNCASTNGEFIVDCISRKYPSRLRAGVSLATRKANMAFLRDRVIEAGLCGGTKMGWNLKRGGPELSIDYMVHVRNGQPWGVDIGQAYDDTRRPLRLVWNVDHITPHYKKYNKSYSCK